MICFPPTRLAGRPAGLACQAAGLPPVPLPPTTAPSKPPRATHPPTTRPFSSPIYHPPAGVAINKVLTNPDWAARHRWVLRRLWGAQLIGAPGRWPQFRHFPQLHTLELHCDNQAVADSLQREGADLQHFESRVLQPLAQLKRLALRQFGSADLARLPASLECLDADLYTALPLALPPGMQLQELTLTSSRLLVDWALLCTQVGRGGWDAPVLPCLPILLGAVALGCCACRQASAPADRHLTRASQPRHAMCPRQLPSRLAPPPALTACPHRLPACLPLHSIACLSCRSASCSR